MHVVIYCQANIDSQGNDLQAIKLTRIAESKGWYIKRIFQEKNCETSNIASRSELKSLMDYAKKTHIDVVIISEIFAIGDGVSDIVNSIELFHDMGIGIFINEFNLLTFENGQETSTSKMLFKALSIGAQIERNQRLVRQREGVEIARTKGVYAGRKKGANATPDALLKKYRNITELIEKSDLSVRAIAKKTNHSINTVRKVKQLKDL